MYFPGFLGQRFEQQYEVHFSRIRKISFLFQFNAFSSRLLVAYSSGSIFQIILSIFLDPPVWPENRVDVDFGTFGGTLDPGNVADTSVAGLECRISIVCAVSIPGSRISRHRSSCLRFCHGVCRLSVKETVVAVLVFMCIKGLCMVRFYLSVSDSADRVETQIAPFFAASPKDQQPAGLSAL